MIIRTVCKNSSTAKVLSARRNFKRLIEAKLQAELSRCMYSLHGLEPLIRPVLAAVFHLLIVVAYCMPGSAHSQAAWAIWRIKSRAGTALTVRPSLTALRSHGLSALSAATLT